MAGCINPVAYSPYGQQSAQQKRMAHLGFNGEMCEARTDWYFLGNGYRVYNPRLMRFHSPDKFSPFGKGGMNAYMYCGGEPVNRVDPTGEGASWFFERFADVMYVLSGVGPSGGGSWNRTGIAVVAVNNSRSTFNTPSRLKKRGKSRNQASAFSDNSATKSVHWAPDVKEPTTSAKTTTSTAAKNGTMSRSPSSSSISSNSSSASTPSTVSTVSTLSIHSHDSGYASSSTGSIRSNASADQRIQERLNALRQN
ncbi:RHS repeat-associated core domain-containing protein|uniref:RHS repeat-associated core domain-containing protein n=1 Tax=Pseudomonas sp. SbOxS1 TaxID=2723884 RepID=UPI0017C373CE|nr:RHS repeat-associated core domain-containing protein [Pseudomonas sp. SbOxS1]NYU02847.1 RHS repeat-associated core domain-containing protein [Pseudomonas sp. SbOxS1]